MNDTGQNFLKEQLGPEGAALATQALSAGWKFGKNIRQQMARDPREKMDIDVNDVDENGLPRLTQDSLKGSDYKYDTKTNRIIDRDRPGEDVDFSRPQGELAEQTIPRVEDEVDNPLAGSEGAFDRLSSYIEQGNRAAAEPMFLKGQGGKLIGPKGEQIDDPTVPKPPEPAPESLPSLEDLQKMPIEEAFPSPPTSQAVSTEEQLNQLPSLDEINLQSRIDNLKSEPKVDQPTEAANEPEQLSRVDATPEVSEDVLQQAEIRNVVRPPVEPAPYQRPGTSYRVQGRPTEPAPQEPTQIQESTPAPEQRAIPSEAPEPQAPQVPQAQPEPAVRPAQDVRPTAEDIQPAEPAPKPATDEFGLEPSEESTAFKPVSGYEPPEPEAELPEAYKAAGGELTDPSAEIATTAATTTAEETGISLTEAATAAIPGLGELGIIAGAIGGIVSAVEGAKKEAQEAAQTASHMIAQPTIALDSAPTFDSSFGK